MRVTVADTGAGIAPEDLPHIFERFYRADKSRDRATGGAGLGLAIARQIVELHGSSLEVESRPGRGPGSPFVLPVPAAARTCVIQTRGFRDTFVTTHPYIQGMKTLTLAAVVLVISTLAFGQSMMKSADGAGERAP